jgi:hypothetical protein
VTVDQPGHEGGIAEVDGGGRGGNGDADVDDRAAVDQEVRPIDHPLTVEQPRRPNLEHDEPPRLLDPGVEPVRRDRDRRFGPGLIGGQDVVDVIGAVDDPQRLVGTVEGGDERL